MALTLRRLFLTAGHGALGVWLCLFVAFGLFTAGAARAEDPAERAAQIRDEILARRRVQSERAVQVEADQAGQSLQRAADEARARLDRSRSDLEAASERLGRTRAQHDRLLAQLGELDAAAQRERAVRRARVAAMYRAADLGAGAAGWQSGAGTKSIRLARYLVAAASRTGAGSATLEVQRGSYIAALDQSRVDQQNAADEMRRLQDLAVVAENDLARVQEQQVEAAAPPRPMDAAATSDLAAAAAELERRVAAGGATTDVAEAPQYEDSLAQARDDAEAQAEEQGQARDDAEAQAEELAQARDDAKARADEKAKAQEQARADEKALALADAQALARARARAAQQREAAGAAVDPGAAAGRARRPGESTFDWSDQRTETAGSAPVTEAAGGSGSAAAVAAVEPGGAGAQADKPGLLSRLFGGGNEEAKRFASSKGALAPPLSGRVVANFGQRHENGATYRGVIVRSSRGAPVKAVAAGTVLFAGPLAGMGDTLIVSHGGRYHTVYGRLGTVRFKVGESVKPGEVVGTLPADDGDLHFEMREQGRAVDPLPWLRGAGDSLSR